MMSSQLGRMILDRSAATEDEMSAAPNPDGGYGPMDGLLEEIADRADNNSRFERGRRPGTQPSTD
jgi:hypothetical protein